MLIRSSKDRTTKFFLTMKIRKSIVALLPALVLLLPSCQETELDYVRPEKQGNVYANVPAPVNCDPETKGISIDADNKAVFKWIKDVDNINVFSSKKGESMIYSIKEVSSENPTHCSFLVEDFALKTGNTYYGFYPSTNSNDPSKVIIDYTIQRQYALDDDSHLSAYSYMVSAPVEATESGAGFAFSHKSGWITFKILAKDDFTAEKIVVSTTTPEAFIVKGTMDVVSQDITVTKAVSSVVLYLGEPEEGLEIKGGIPTRAFMALNDVVELSDVKAVLSGHDKNGNAVEVVKEITGTRFYKNGSAGSITLQQEGAVAKQAKIGDTYYETLADAVTAAEAGNTVEILVADTYKIPNLPKNITIKGDVAGVVFDCVGTGSIASVPNGATFENITFEMGQTNYHGFQHAGTINMNGCTLNGKFFSYGDMNFTGCTFNQTAEDYNMWCYGQDLTYTDCVFNSKGKFLNVYNEGNGDWNVTFDGCTFNSDKKNKAAINIKETCTKEGVAIILGWNVVIKDCRVNDESMFPEASTEDSGSALFVGSPLWQVDDRNAKSIADRKVTVTVDDIQVYPAPLVSVAKVGDTEYTTLEDAIKAALAANDGVAVELLSDITYAEGAAWTPIVFNGGTVVIDGKGYTVKGLPGMLFNKQGSGGHHLRMSNITFDGAKVNDETGNAAVIVGYADSMNELYFENVTVRNSTVIGSNYAAAFVGYAAGYSGNDGPVFQQVVFKNCTAENNTISGGGSTGALMGHASGNKWASITVEGATVENNAVTCTGTSTNKAGSVFGTVGAAGAELGPNGESAGLFVSATVSGNTVTSGGTNITTICGRQGSTGGRLVMNAGGSYDARPYNESDSAWASCVAGYDLSENAGIWTVVKKAEVAKIGDTSYGSIEEALAAATDGQTITIVSDFAPAVTIQVNKQITIDLAGHTIANTADLWVGNNWSIFSVKNGGNLTITGEGIIDAKENDCYAFDVCDGASLTIVNGTIIGNISAVYANKGNVTINGGAFSIKQKNSGSDPNKFLLNCLDENYKNGSASIVVKGGSFEGFNPANNAAEGAGTNFCAEGYTAVENDGVWTVKECAEVIPVSTQEELIAAIESAENGATIKLAPGTYTTYGTTYARGKTITFEGDGEVTWKYGKDYVVDGEGCADYSFEGSNVTFKNIIFRDNVSGENNYRGFVRIGSTKFVDCEFYDMITYLGGNKAEFKNCTFNAPGTGYSFWVYGIKETIYDGCTINCAGKFVNAYIEGTNKGESTIIYKDCTLISSAPNKSALNLKNSNDWNVYFLGTNKVKGLSANSTTGSRLFQVEAGSNNYKVYAGDTEETATLIWNNGKTDDYFVPETVVE